jgi:cytohesin
MKPASLELKRACSAGDLAEARRLLDAGADPNSTDEHGSGTLLTFHPAIVECLLSRGADPNIQTNENGSSVLAGLAYMNQVECVRILLQHGADPNRGREASGETPLHHALTKNETARGPLVKLLLDHGSNPNAKTIPGVLSYNFWRDARTRGETPLHRAAAYASAETIKHLLTAGANPTLQDINGDTPRAWASWHLREKAVVDLLNPGTNGQGAA